MTIEALTWACFRARLSYRRRTPALVPELTSATPSAGQQNGRPPRSERSGNWSCKLAGTPQLVGVEPKLSQVGEAAQRRRYLPVNWFSERRSLSRLARLPPPLPAAGFRRPFQAMQVAPPVSPAVEPKLGRLALPNAAAVNWFSERRSLSRLARCPTPGSPLLLERRSHSRLWPPPVSPRATASETGCAHAIGPEAAPPVSPRATFAERGAGARNLNVYVRPRHDGSLCRCRSVGWGLCLHGL